MRSPSALSIDWIPPALAAEAWEFDRHPAKQPFYQRHGLTWERLAAAFDAGELVPWPRGERLGELTVQLSYSAFDDYLTYLAAAKRGYRQNYLKLERELQRHGALTLQAPIVLCCGDEALLFAGWRRLCLAWNYGMVPWVWKVTIP